MSNDQIISTYLDEIDRMTGTSSTQPPVPSYEQLEAEYHAMLRNPDSTRADFMCGIMCGMQIWHAMACSNMDA